jgi:alpha-D-ribose 1-methylphosphonate 5-triphosphate synthase subunit PhnG
MLEPTTTDRRERLRALALADPAALRAAWDALGEAPVHTVLKGPETGLVMVRGRIGGGGAPFNVGEATVTRCVVRLGTGEVGFGHVLGRDGERARIVALLDAMGEHPATADRVAREVVAPLAAASSAAAEARAAEVAATRVDFFTMARGDPEA